MVGRQHEAAVHGRPRVIRVTLEACRLPKKLVVIDRFATNQAFQHQRGHPPGRRRAQTAAQWNVGVHAQVVALGRTAGRQVCVNDVDLRRKVRKSTRVLRRPTARNQACFQPNIEGQAQAVEPGAKVRRRRGHTHRVSHGVTMASERRKRNRERGVSPLTSLFVPQRLYRIQSRSSSCGPEAEENTYGGAEYEGHRNSLK